MQTIDTPTDSRINKSFWFDTNNGFICGGNHSESGFIYSTTDGGSSWVKRLDPDNHSLYDIKFINDTLGFCCGDDVSLYQTINKGISWKKIDLTSHYDQFYNGTLRQIVVANNSLIIVGGKNYNVGLIVSYKNGKLNSGFKGTSNELRSGFSFSDTNFVSCGYGTAYRSQSDLINYSPVILSHDFFTDAITLNSSSGIACSYEGAIYKIIDAGNITTKIYDHNRLLNKRINFNALYFKNENEGCVVANSGVLMKTTDGKKFTEIKTSNKHDYLSIVSNNANELIVSTSNGKLIKFSY